MPQYRCPGCDALLKTGQAVPPGRKVQCPSCRETFEPLSEEVPAAVAVEDDYDDYDDAPAEPRRKKRRKAAKRRKKSGGAVGVVVAMSLLLLAGVGVLVYFLLAGGNDPMKFAPRGTVIVGQVNLQPLYDDEDLGEKVKEAFREKDAPAGGVLPDRVTFFLTGGGGLPQPGAFVSDADEPFERKDVVGVANEESNDAGGFYKKPGRKPKIFFFRDGDKRVVQTDLQGRALENLMRGKGGEFTEELDAMIGRVDSHDFWLALDWKETTRGANLGASLRGAPLPVAAIQALIDAKAAGIWIDLNDGDIELRVELLCKNETDSSRLAEEANKALTTFKGELRKKAGGVPPQVKPFLDLLESLTVERDGDYVVAGVTVSRELVRKAVKEGGDALPRVPLPFGGRAQGRFN